MSVVFSYYIYLTVDMGLQQNFMDKDLKRLIQSRKVKVKLKGELHPVTDKYGNVQWQLKYHLVPKT